MPAFYSVSNFSSSHNEAAMTNIKLARDLFLHSHLLQWKSAPYPHHPRCYSSIPGILGPYSVSKAPTFSLPCSNSVSPAVTLSWPGVAQPLLEEHSNLSSRANFPLFLRYRLGSFSCLREPPGSAVMSQREPPVTYIQVYPLSVCHTKQHLEGQ